jgi:hypothetical protein
MAQEFVGSIVTVIRSATSPSRNYIANIFNALDNPRVARPLRRILAPATAPPLATASDKPCHINPKR